ncbi:hypothetical protein QZM03_17000 [Burkholderia multivorans]|nr:hypothetical protein [Burkholderia multivorans]
MKVFLKQPTVGYAAAGLLGIALLSGCTASGGPTYNVQAIQRHGQTSPIFRASCSGLTGHIEQCLQAAKQVCQTKTPAIVETMGPPNAALPTGVDVREVSFVCTEPVASVPATAPQAQVGPNVPSNARH